jgi:hypothetical protein
MQSSITSNFNTPNHTKLQSKEQVRRDKILLSQSVSIPPGNIQKFNSKEVNKSANFLNIKQHPSQDELLDEEYQMESS